MNDNSKFWDAIDSARAELYGSHHYDHETDVEYNFPAKNKITYAKAYQYCMVSLDNFIKIEEVFNELELIKIQIQYSQDFARLNKEFTTDFILNFSYKNWIVRINIIAEQLIFLVNHIYQLMLPNENMVQAVFEHAKVKQNKALYLILVKIIDFLQEKTIINIKAKSIKKTRNEILHTAKFKHNLIENLSVKLFQFKYGMIETLDDEDIYLEEGQVSEKIKNEITQFTNQFLNEYSKLEELFAVEFKENFKKLML